MGQAKRRGSYEERRAAAVKRQMVLPPIRISNRSWATLVADAMLTAGDVAEVDPDGGQYEEGARTTNE